MHDGWVVAFAASVCAGALVVGWGGGSGPTVPLAVALVLATLAVASRTPFAWCAAGAVLAASLAGRAWDGVVPARAGPVDGIATVLGDARAVGPATAVVVRVDGRRFEAWGRGAVGATLRRTEVGEQVLLRGAITPPTSRARERLARRHVVGRIIVERAERLGAPPRLQAAATRMRAVLRDGARSLPTADRALFTGIVIGDDRALPPAVVDDMRAAGLGHLTAVSGQNVAFVIATVTPLLARLRPAVRWGAALTVLGAFCVLTRAEPSVLRATAMAGLAVSASALARTASSVRVLALAVAGLVLVDPMLVWSVGFILSAGATLGLVVLARPITQALPGPRWLAGALGVTLAAQAGVAPVSVAVFGGLPTVALVANVLAVPVAGPVMVWGLTAGLAAGALPPPVAAVLHVPTFLMLRWIQGVAAAAAAVPLGMAGAASMVVVAVALVLAAVGAQPALGPWRGVVRCLAATCAVVGLVVVPARGAGPSPVHDAEVGGARLWVVPDPRGDSVVVVLARGDPRTPDRLRRAGVRRADVLVVAASDRDTIEVAEALQRRLAPRVLLGPTRSTLPGVRHPPPGTAVAAGPVLVEVTAATDRRLTVEVVVADG